LLSRMPKIDLSGVEMKAADILNRSAGLCTI
jgi:hypothetical protein